MNIQEYIFRCQICGNCKTDSYCMNCNRQEIKYKDYYHKCSNCYSYYEGNIYHCVICGKYCEPLINTFLCECGIYSSIMKPICPCGNPISSYGYFFVLKKTCQCKKTKPGK